MGYHHAGVTKAAQTNKNIPMGACASSSERGEGQASIRQDAAIDILPTDSSHKKNVASKQEGRQ